jgi:ABC-type bacteriocin/lantibiotic exporter with double-glycine peptidase domain
MSSVGPIHAQALWLERLGFGRPAAWRYFARYFRSHRRGLALYAVAAATVAAAMVPILLIVRLAIDRAIPQADARLLIGLGAAILLLRLATAVATLVLRRYVLRVTKGAIGTMRSDLIAKLYRMEDMTRTHTDIDRLQTEIVQDTERLDVLLGGMLSSLLPAACTTAALLVLLLLTSWSLVLIAAVATPIVWSVARFTQQRVGRDLAVFQDDFRRFNSGVSFVLRQMDLTRTQAAEREEVARQQAIVRDLAQSGVRMAWSFALHGQLQGAVVGMLGIGLLIAGGLEVMYGLMTLGQFLAFYLGAGILSGSALTLTEGTTGIVAAGVSLGKLAALDAQPMAIPYGGTRPIEFSGRIALCAVHFAYGDTPVLRGVDFDLAPGQHVAIVGSNGSGKTTLLKVLLGILRPDAGVALADFEPYDQIDLEQLRRRIGMVTQRSTFFHSTVRANIAYGEPGASEEAVIAAARASCAHEFICELPRGYDTLIGDAGMTLSGGECQRIALARALLRRPRVLLLDEPTNHLDAAAVGQILSNLRRLADSPAILVVSHDPRVVGFVERTYHLRDGKLQPAAPKSADRVLALTS